MTVSYNLEVSTSGLFAFLKILFCRWRGSVWKGVWADAAVYLALHYVIYFVYKRALSSEQQDVFEVVAEFVNISITHIPVTFILGFYVNIVMARWWVNFKTIAWPEAVALKTATYINGTDDVSRMYRRSIVRYCILSQIIALRGMNSSVKKRFPTPDHLIEAGVATAAEMKRYDDCKIKFPKAWVPFQWACTAAARARKEGLIDNDVALVDLVSEINLMRINVRDLGFYDWLSLPFMYTQIATLAVYVYFLGTLLGRQSIRPVGEITNFSRSNGTFLHDNEWLSHRTAQIDLYFPVFTMLEFFFYVGWLKVALTMLTPFGEDDEDFEMNFIIERNLEVSFTIVDRNFGVTPPLERDANWTNADVTVPHTAASYGVMDSSRCASGSCDGVMVSKSDAEVVVTADLGPRRRRLLSLQKSSQPDETTVEVPTGNLSTRRKDGRILHTRVVRPSFSESTGLPRNLSAVSFASVDSVGWMSEGRRYSASHRKISETESYLQDLHHSDKQL